MRLQPGQISIFKTQILQNVYRSGTPYSSWHEPVGFPTGVSVYNRVAKCKVPLTLRKERYACWYMCGPTVYDSAHIGHAYCYVKFDIIRRILINFFDINVVLVMGVTDIDDKIIARAEKLKDDVKVVSKQYEKEFFEDLSNLNVLSPSITVRVTECIPRIIQFIQNICDKGLAYKATDGSVYFDTSVFKYYGKLYPIIDSNTNENPLKKSPHDFALWKAAKPKEPFWHSPWGNGRPGWHIECSTIASSIFGSELDIHSGGIDLVFPHHENEEAQSCAYHSVHQWVNYWLHSGHLHLKGSEKMSKSLKNTIGVGEFLKSFSGDQFRMYCLLSQYRADVEYTNASMEHAVAIHKKVESFLSDCDAYIQGKLPHCYINEEEFVENILNTRKNILCALADDFDTPKVLGILLDFISYANKSLRASPLESDQLNDSSVSMVAAAFSFVQNIVGKLGFHFLPLELFDNSNTNVIRIIDLLLGFRNEVRDIALSEIKSKGANKGISEKLLKICDDVRNNFMDCGVEIKDHGAKSSWSKKQ